MVIAIILTMALPAVALAQCPPTECPPTECPPDNCQNSYGNGYPMFPTFAASIMTTYNGLIYNRVAGYGLQLGFPGMSSSLHSTSSLLGVLTHNRVYASSYGLAL